MEDQMARKKTKDKKGMKYKMREAEKLRRLEQQINKDHEKKNKYGGRYGK